MTACDCNNCKEVAFQHGHRTRGGGLYKLLSQAVKARKDRENEDIEEWAASLAAAAIEAESSTPK